MKKILILVIIFSLMVPYNLFAEKKSDKSVGYALVGVAAIVGIYTIFKPKVKPKEKNIYDKTFEEIHFICDVFEISKLKKIDNEEDLNLFLDKFWTVRSNNTFDAKTEYYKRYNYVKHRYLKHGKLTDKGLAVIKYGIPDEVLTFPGKEFNLKDGNASVSSDMTDPVNPSSVKLSSDGNQPQGETVSDYTVFVYWNIHDIEDRSGLFDDIAVGQAKIIFGNQSGDGRENQIYSNIPEEWSDGRVLRF